MQYYYYWSQQLLTASTLTIIIIIKQINKQNKQNAFDEIVWLSVVIVWWNASINICTINTYYTSALKTIYYKDKLLLLLLLLPLTYIKMTAAYFNHYNFVHPVHTPYTCFRMHRNTLIFVHIFFPFSSFDWIKLIKVSEILINYW